MANNLDILSKLPQLQWRGIVVPCQANSLSFEHGQAEHYQHGSDGAYVEHTGRKSARFSFRIPFRVGIAGSYTNIYENLYPETFRDFWNACLDGSTGVLLHPEFGEIDAKVSSFRLSVDPMQRDGYDVDVDWIETVEAGVSIADNALSPISEAVGLAEGLEETSGEINPPITYDDGSGDDLLTTLKKIEGALLLAQLEVQDMLASINNAVSGVNSMIDLCNNVTDPEAWGVMESLKQIEANLQTAKDKLSPSQERIEFVIAARTMTTREAAASASMDLAAFFEVNPRLARSPEIRQGKEYFVKVKG